MRRRLNDLLPAGAGRDSNSIACSSVPSGREQKEAEPAASDGSNRGHEVAFVWPGAAVATEVPTSHGSCNGSKSN